MRQRASLVRRLSSSVLGLAAAGLLLGTLAGTRATVNAQAGPTTPAPAVIRLLLPSVMRDRGGPAATATATSGVVRPTATSTPTGTPGPIATVSLTGTPLPTRTSLPGGGQRPQDRHTIETSAFGSITYKYWRYLPEAWATDTARTWPVLIFLHGIGEIGSDPTVVLRNGPPRLVNEGNDMCFTTPTGLECFVVLSPQVPAGQGWWSNGYPADLITIAAGQLRGDPDRIYLTGLSMGGGGTWDFAAAVSGPVPNARVLAAIAPIAGASSPSGAGPCRIATERLPVFAFHGSADPTVPLANSQNWVNAINACTPAPNPAARLTIYAGVNHNSWTITYDPRFWVEPGRNLYQWLLQYAR